MFHLKTSSDDTNKGTQKNVHIYITVGRTQGLHYTYIRFPKTLKYYTKLQFMNLFHL